MSIIELIQNNWYFISAISAIVLWGIKLELNSWRNQLEIENLKNDQGRQDKMISDKFRELDSRISEFRDEQGKRFDALGQSVEKIIFRLGDSKDGNR